MRLKQALLSRKWQYPIAIAAGTLPLPLLLCARLTPQTPYLGCAVAGLFALLSMLCMGAPGRARLAAGAVGAAILLAAGFFALPWREAWQLLILPAVYAGLLLLTLPIGGWGREEELHPAFWILGILCHVAAQMMQFVNERAGDPVYHPIAPALTAGFLLFAALTLLSMNRLSLTSAAAMGRPASTAIRRRNSVLTLGALALTALIAALPAVVRFIERVCMGVLRAVARLIAWLASLFVGDEELVSAPGGSMELSPFAAETTEPSGLAQFMEKVALVLAVAALAAALFFALRILLKKLKRLLRWLWNRLSAYAATASEDYEDEISDTRDDGDRQQHTLLGLLRRRANPLRGIDERRLSPAARIRFRYLKLWLKHADWKPGRTARENLPVEAAALYERARYSRHEITDDDAEAFLRHTQSL